MNSQKTAAARLDTINDEFFRRIIDRIITEAATYYGDRLAAIYVHGSVHRGEAVRGVSDADMAVFIHEERRDEDAAWRIATNDRLQTELPEFGWHWIPTATSVSVLSAFRSGDALDSRAARRGRGWTHLLRDDATLVCGTDLVRDLPATPTDRDWALAKYELSRNTIRHAAGLPCVPDTAEAEEELRQWPLPKEANRRLRKLARMGVLGGAYLLMAQDRFVSYKGTDVLPLLQRELPEWAPLLKATEELYVVPTDVVSDDINEYLSRLAAWMDWVAEQLTTDPKA